MKLISNSFGSCLHEIRRRRRLSQKEVAIEAGMDQSYLAGMEAGRRPPPRERQLVRLINALEATPGEEKELRDAHALSRLVGVVEEVDPRRCGAFANVAFQLLKLPIEELQKVEVSNPWLAHESQNKEAAQMKT